MNRDRIKLTHHPEKTTFKKPGYIKVKDVSNLFRLKKIDHTTNKDMRNLFKLKRENESTIKDRIITDIRNFFEYEEDYYEPVRAGHFCSSN